MKKILVISATFFPQNRNSVLRIGQWVKYLAKYDYEITVLTTKKYPFLGPFDLNEELSEKVQIVEVDFLPEFLVKKLSSSNVTTSSNKISSKIDHIKLFVRKLRKYIGSFFDMYDLWINPALKKAIELQEEKHFDYIISSFSPPAVHIIAHKLKNKFPNIKWIADFRDLWAYNHLITSKGIFKVLERQKERKVISNADAIITVSEFLSEIMARVYTKQVFTIENGFDPEEFKNWKEIIKPFPEINEKIIISYLGTIYPQKRDPSILFEAVNELIDEKIIRKEQIEINFYGNNRKELVEILIK